MIATKKDVPDITIDKIVNYLNRTIKTEKGCWVWQGAKSPDRHARVNINSQAYYLHRVIFKAVGNRLDKSLELDHLCREPSCVNPKHLEQVTHRVNSERGEAGTHLKNKTHCPQGHPYSGDNLYVFPSGGRSCRTCTRVSGRKHDLKRRSKC